MTALHCRMQRCRRPSDGGERGQGLIEFAMLAPFILVLMLVLLDFAIAIDQREVLDHAIREGGRAAALGESTDLIAARTTAQADGLIDDSDVSVCYEDIDGNGSAGDFGDAVRVTISHEYTFALAAELMDALGMAAPTVELNPVADVRLEDDVLVAPEC